MAQVAQEGVVVPAVYRRIASVSAKLAKDGIGKTRRNQQQNYQFRGIDDVLNTLATMLVEDGLLILPRCLSRTTTERETKSGGTLFYTAVEAAFDFVAVEDASTHTVVTYGEAMDSADKSTNKAMSAAYKYAAILAFCIPTEGDNDADATTHEPGRPVTSSVTPPVTSPVTRQRASEGAQPPAPEEPVWTSVKSVRKVKSGKNARGPWNLWIVAFDHGAEFKTFDDDLASKAEQARKSGDGVSIAVNGDTLTNLMLRNG